MKKRAISLLFPVKYGMGFGEELEVEGSKESIEDLRGELDKLKEDNSKLSEYNKNLSTMIEKLAEQEPEEENFDEETMSAKDIAAKIVTKELKKNNDMWEKKFVELQARQIGNQQQMGMAKIDSDPELRGLWDRYEKDIDRLRKSHNSWKTVEPIELLAYIHGKKSLQSGGKKNVKLVKDNAIPDINDVGSRDVGEVSKEEMIRKSKFAELGGDPDIRARVEAAWNAVVTGDE